MMRFFKLLYKHIDITLLVLLLISFTLGLYSMFTKTGGPTIVGYVIQAALSILIIGDIAFLLGERKKAKRA
ncbi:hypothetical protein [Bacillus manliponensis]|uniref:hypothetical protein n=1 Tax=Bacillus manliponensis TaxID=574376 RepID=UPI0035186822